MINGITYTGEVTISDNRGMYIRKRNKGTSNLFLSLSELLAGIGLDKIKQKLPLSIGLIHDNNSIINDEYINTHLNFSNYDNVKLTLSDLFIVDRRIDIETTSVYFSTLLSSNQIKTVVKSLNLNGCYAMLVDGDSRILAYSAFDYDSIRAVCNDTSGKAQAVVEWKMFFSNKEANE